MYNRNEKDCNTKLIDKIYNDVSKKMIFFVYIPIYRRDFDFNDEDEDSQSNASAYLSY